MSTEQQQTIILTQIMNNQTELFAQIKEINKNLVIIARLEERQLTDRSTISRIGEEVRDSTEGLRLLSDRVTVVEGTTSGRGKIFNWLAMLVASGIVALAVTWAKISNTP